MSELQTQGDLRGHWWGILWPRASRNCSRGSRTISALGAPLALLIGVLFAVSLIVILLLFSVVFVLSTRLLSDPQHKTHDVGER